MKALILISLLFFMGCADNIQEGINQGRPHQRSRGSDSKYDRELNDDINKCDEMETGCMEHCRSVFCEETCHIRRMDCAERALELYKIQLDLD